MSADDRCAGCPHAAGLALSSDPEHEVLRRNESIFHAIAARDVETLARLSSPALRFETADGDRGDRDAWLAGVRAIPFVIESISNTELRLRLDGDRAVLCGVQRARVIVDGQPIDDEGQFCDRWEARPSLRRQARARAGEAHDGDWRVAFVGVPPRAR